MPQLSDAAALATRSEASFRATSQRSGVTSSASTTKQVCPLVEFGKLTWTALEGQQSSALQN